MKTYSGSVAKGLGISWSSKTVTITSLRVGTTLLFNFYMKLDSGSAPSVTDYTGFSVASSNVLTESTSGEHVASSTLVGKATASTVTITFNVAISNRFLFTAYQA